MSENEKFEAWYSPKYGTPLKLGDSDQYSSNHAQGMWQSWQAALAASGGNAAPGLMDERAAFEADTLDLYAAATFNRFPNSDRYNVAWVQDQWGGWQRRAKYAAASAPNAALVAAAQATMAWWSEHQYDTVSDGEGGEYNVFDSEPEFVKSARAALSAAGQEVGK